MDNGKRRSVREIQPTDIDSITDYWLNSDADYLRAMGADINKLPNRDDWRQMLSTQIAQAYPEKQSYAIIWELDDQPIGHSNVNKIVFGEEAYMHLHLWRPEHRNGGNGLAFLSMAIPYFFKNLQLKRL